MASPFSLFRKYMKPLMVVLCGMAMLAFVVVDPLMQYWSSKAQGGPGGPDGAQVVVTWKDGQLTESQLAQLVDRRRLLARFIAQVYQTGLDLARIEGAEDLQLAVQVPNLPTEHSQRVEEDVVRTQIIADEARKMGMAVSDEAVREYLNKLGRNRISFEEMKYIFDELFGARRVPPQFILDAVREELLKQNFLASYAFSVSTQLPEQRWADWLQVNDRVIVEAAAIKTSDFVSQVPDPTDAELLAFYNEYKDREQMPDFRYTPELPSPLPGFKVPRMVAVQYLEGNFDTEVQRLMSTITEEEIAQYYEENKRQFEKAGSGFMAEPATEAPADAPSKEEAEKALFDVPAGEKPEAPPEQQTEEKPATQEGENSAVEGSESETPETKPETPAESTEAPADEPAPPKDGQSRQSAASSPFRLVALQEPATETPATSDESDKPAEEQPAADSARTDSDTPEPESPETETPETPPAPAAETTPASESPAAELPAEKPVEYQPLDEVREEIKTLLARRKVGDELREKMQNLRNQLRPAYLNYYDGVLAARAEKKTAPEPPAELKDLQALAEPNGLTYHDTGKISFWKLRDSQIGQSVDANESASQPLPFVALAIERLKNYEPIVTRDLDGNRYLAMKTDDVPAYVPKLEDIRDEVVQAWKRQKASELALAEAKQLAEEIQKTGETLGDKFAGDPKVEVVVTDPFAQVTMGDISPTTMRVSFRLSDPAPIVAAGPDFLTKVFELKDGEVGAVFNHDHSIAYLVRIQKHLESPEELRQNYLSELASRNWIGGPTMEQNNTQNALIALLSGLLGEADVDWKRTPDQFDQMEGG